MNITHTKQTNRNLKSEAKIYFCLKCVPFIEKGSLLNHTVPPAVCECVFRAIRCLGNACGTRLLFNAESFFKGWSQGGSGRKFPGTERSAVLCSRGSPQQQDASVVGRKGSFAKNGLEYLSHLKQAGTNKILGISAQNDNKKSRCVIFNPANSSPY